MPFSTFLYQQDIVNILLLVEEPLNVLDKLSLLASSNLHELAIVVCGKARGHMDEDDLEGKD